MKNINFTLKDIVQYSVFIFTLGGYFAADVYNDKVYRAENKKYYELTYQRTDQLQKAVDMLIESKEIDRLNLRKIELEVAQIKAKLNM